MPEPEDDLAAGDLDLVRQIAAAVGQLAGVVRLEPTLATLRSRWLPNSDAVDGVRLLRRGWTVDVDLSIAARGPDSARVTAIGVRDLVRTLVSERGLLPGRIEVTVLEVTGLEVSGLEVSGLDPRGLEVAG